MNKRIIPVLTMDSNQRLVKTIQFGDRTYIGDPLNCIRIFNELEVDEICLIDIDATKDNRKPNFDFIKIFASECFMPLSYGGAISEISDCKTLNLCGVEKFILKSSLNNSFLLKEISSVYGSQSLVGCVDYCSSNIIQNDIEKTIFELKKNGVGEIILQDIDRDGVRGGYDLLNIRAIANKTDLPIVPLGGGGKFEHISSVIEAGADAVASGSMFVFYGELRAVLIHYPKKI